MEWKPGIPEADGDYYFRSVPGTEGDTLKASPVTLEGHTRSSVLAYLSNFDNIEHLGPIMPEMAEAWDKERDQLFYKIICGIVVSAQLVLDGAKALKKDIEIDMVIRCPSCGHKLEFSDDILVCECKMLCCDSCSFTDPEGVILCPECYEGLLAERQDMAEDEQIREDTGGRR
jgi:DNA-directed RNA polymerase subunit RPC12/RpoP